LPSGLHGKFGIEAAKHGKHVITTKPMDVSLANCDALIRATEENGVKLLVDFGERYGEWNRKVRAAVETGAIGKPILCELRMKWFRADSYYEGWHGTWELDGGGSIMNQGVHYVDLMLWFMGPVKRVIGAHYGVYAHEHCETEDLTSAILEFENGAVGNVITTTTFPGDSLSMIQIHGDKGVVGIGPSVWKFTDSEPEIELPPYPNSVIEDAIRVVREGAKPAVDGYEGKRSVALNMAIYEAARSGKAVDVG
jgi:UDP-N-acetyl-2-amino-2-deoxyglucuronate dehydrogenase